MGRWVSEAAVCNNASPNASICWAMANKNSARWQQVSGDIVKMHFPTGSLPDQSLNANFE